MASRARKNGLQAEKVVLRVLAEIGWTPTETEEEAVYRVVLTDDEASPVRVAVVKVRIDVERFLFLLDFADAVPRRTRRKVMEFITRANHGMVVGNFELDLDSGRLRFKSSLDFTKVPLTAQLVRNAILCAVDAVEGYAVHLREVARGAADVVTAIEEAERAIMAAAEGS